MNDDTSTLNAANNIQKVENPIQNIVGHVFSIISGSISWFLGLRWYIILFIVVIGSYLFFQIQYAFETRRNLREQKKEATKNGKESGNKPEGMEEYNVEDKYGRRTETEPRRGILRQSNGENGKKRVSFSGIPNSSDENGVTDILQQIYKWWILPWIYVVFRNNGIR
jgi:hypothetical protein